MKILPMDTEFFYADGRTDGQTDMTKITVPFYNFENALKNKEAVLGNRTENLSMLRRIVVTIVAVRKQQCVLSLLLGCMSLFTV